MLVKINQLIPHKNTEYIVKSFICFSMLLVVLALTSCQNESPLVGPESIDARYTETNEPNWVGLPQADSKRLEKVFNAGETITVNEGGEIVIDETYTSSSGLQVTTYSSIQFAPGCVQEDVYITVEIDDETGVSSFLPSQVFNFPAILNQKFTGLDLSGVNPADIQLYYLKLDGTYDVMAYDDLIVDVSAGSIEVVNGQIPHFSRYGYGF